MITAACIYLMVKTREGAWFVGAIIAGNVEGNLLIHIARAITGGTTP